MIPTPQALNVYKLLAKELRYSGSPGILDISGIILALDLAPNETLEALRELYQSGLVDMNQLKTAEFHTPED